eukprot:1157323-Pelagomonas_calceolata.AAC.5
MDSQTASQSDMQHTRPHQWESALQDTHVDMMKNCHPQAPGYYLVSLYIIQAHKTVPLESTYDFSYLYFYDTCPVFHEL